MHLRRPVTAPEGTTPGLSQPGSSARPAYRLGTGPPGIRITGLYGRGDGKGCGMPPVRTLDRPVAPRSQASRSTGHGNRRSTRWDSLDVLRGLALCWMIAHHFAKWTGGRVEERFVGFEGFVLTDLAAPMFAVGVGAAGFLVGRQISRDRSRARRAAVRWGQVLLLGVAIDVAVGGGIDGGGVLPSLAVLGSLVTAVAAFGVARPALWWLVAISCAFAAVPVATGASGGFVNELWTGPFSIVVYGVFAAAGAALAAHAGGGGEGSLPLLRASAIVLLVGTLGAWLAPGVLAPDGIWPPERHPGDLAFTVWGLVGTLLVWATVRRALPVTSWLGAGLARAGRRTLLIFGAHYVVKIVLQHTDRLETLDSWRWGIATWLAVAVACALAMAPKPSSREPAADRAEEPTSSAAGSPTG